MKYIGRLIRVDSYPEKAHYGMILSFREDSERWWLEYYDFKMRYRAHYTGYGELELSPLIDII